MANIMAACNVDDPLSRYMTKDILKYWTSYRAGCLRFLQNVVVTPGTICWVAETDESDDEPETAGDGKVKPKTTSGEVVGWVIWTRLGKSTVARNWQRQGEDWSTRLEAALCKIRNRYFDFLDPTIDHAHMSELRPVLDRETDPEIFGERWNLEGLYVAKDWQRRQVGSLMLNWGQQQARAESVPIVVKSSPVGTLFYKRAGFKAFSREPFDQFFDTRPGGMHALVWEPPGFEGRWLEPGIKKAAEAEAETKQGIEA